MRKNTTGTNLSAMASHLEWEWRGSADEGGGGEERKKRIHIGSVRLPRHVSSPDNVKKSQGMKRSEIIGPDIELNVTVLLNGQSYIQLLPSGRWFSHERVPPAGQLSCSEETAQKEKLGGKAA